MCEPLELFLVSFYPVVCPNAGQTPPLFSATFHNPDHATANRTEKRSGRPGISFLIGLWSQSTQGPSGNNGTSPFILIGCLCPAMAHIRLDDDDDGKR